MSVYAVFRMRKEHGMGLDWIEFGLDFIELKLDWIGTILIVSDLGVGDWSSNLLINRLML